MEQLYSGKNSWVMLAPPDVGCKTAGRRRLRGDGARWRHGVQRLLCKFAEKEVRGQRTQVKPSLGEDIILKIADRPIRPFCQEMRHSALRVGDFRWVVCDILGFGHLWCCVTKGSRKNKCGHFVVIVPHYFGVDHPQNLKIFRKNCGCSNFAVDRLNWLWHHYAKQKRNGAKNETSPIHLGYDQDAVEPTEDRHVAGVDGRAR